MEAKEMTQEQVQKLRDDVAAELDAEEKGEVHQPSVDASDKKETEEKPVVDPWAGVNPALKQSFDELSQRVADLPKMEARLKQAESRVGSLTNELHNAKKAAATVKDAPTKEQVEAAAESEEEWENLKADFPEWAKALDGRIAKRDAAIMASVVAKIDEKIKAMTPGDLATFNQTIAEGTEEQIQKGILGFMKPNWQATLGTKEYQDWLASQPEEVVSLTKSPFAADAITVLDAFEESVGKQKSAEEIALERKRRIRTSVIPQGKKSTPTKSEADMNPGELRQAIATEVWRE